jgi:SAM-dependent methyltransferase
MIKKKLQLIFYVIFALTVILGCLIAYTLLNFMKTDTLVENYELSVGKDSNVSIEVPSFNTSDRVYLIFNTTSRIDINAPSTLKQLPYDIEGRLFDFENWILFQQQFCFVANETSLNSTIQAQFLDSESPYAVKVFQGEANYTLFNYMDLYGVDYVGVHVQASKNQSSRFQQIILTYPYQQVAEQNFRIEGSVKLLSGKINHVILLLITRDRNWLPYLIAPKERIVLSKTINFNIDLYNQTMLGTTLSRDFSKQIIFVAITIGLDSTQWKYEEEAYADIGIGKITIQNGSEKTIIEPNVSEEYTVNCKLYVFHKFQPTQVYTILVSTFTFLIFAGVFVLVRLNNPKPFLKKIFEPLTKSETVPDYRPKTYEAKLCYKARYEKLYFLLAKFVGKKAAVIIDVGCGLGALNQYLSERSFDVKFYIGCDIDKNSLKKASKIERIVCDVNHLPFKQNAAEVTICSEVLEHTVNPNIGFKELLRITDKWLFVSFPDERIKNALGFRYPEHISEPNVASLKFIAEKEKFALVKSEKFLLIFPPSVFDKMGLCYNSFYRPLITSVFQILSSVFRSLCLIKVILLIFKKSADDSRMLLYTCKQ